MIKYRTGGYRDKLIEPVEVVKETAKQVVVREKDWNGKWYERKCAKVSGYVQFHDTWEEAHAYLMAHAERGVRNATQELDQAKSHLDNVKRLKK